MHKDDAPADFITTGEAARLLGYTDTRSIVRLIDLAEITGHRTPGGHWRVDRESVLGARDRFRNGQRVAS